MQYKVTYLYGGQVSDAVMSQKELDECRSRYEVIEAISVTDKETFVTDSVSELPEADGWTEFSYGGKRWQFDADQLALWDDELGFSFQDYHLLLEPTIESVTAFIQRQGY